MEFANSRKVDVFGEAWAMSEEYELKPVDGYSTIFTKEKKQSPLGNLMKVFYGGYIVSSPPHGYTTVSPASVGSVTNPYTGAAPQWTTTTA